MATINSWGTLVGNVLVIGGFLVGVVTFFIKLNNIKQDVSVIPTIKKDITALKEDNDGLKEEIADIKTILLPHVEDGTKKNHLVMDMSRQLLLKEIESAIELGYATTPQKAVLGALYNSYEENDGNGTVHTLWQQYIDLPNSLPTTMD